MMKPLRLIYLTFLFALLSPNDIHADSQSETETQVANIERAFAKTMADRDFEAFKTFIADDVVFMTNKGALRGKGQVVDAWQKYYQASEAPFSWDPESVVALASGSLALSTGPVTNNKGRVYAYYTSTWQKNASGEWKIVFDKGQKYCPPAGSDKKKVAHH